MKSIAIAALTACVLLSNAVALAGTTGSLVGVVRDAGSFAPIAGARVTVLSPAEQQSTVTDASGRFAFVSLPPDTYTVSAEKVGYTSVSLAGISVFADNQQTLQMSMQPTLKTIANVTSRAAGSLVRPGTTADVYSVNAASQARLSALGGGGNLNSAFSAIASVPGAYVPTNQSGYLQAVHVRGGDAYEVGYEFDGIPVNRAFDNYPSSALGSLGQQELQVYTGATPANAEAQGLAGFINQVIKTGTYPGYGSADLTTGAPAFYHSLNVEAGGASPNRLFSYYVGLGGSNKDIRYVDQSDGTSYASRFGPILGTCFAGLPNLGVFSSCYTNGQPNVGLQESPGWILGPIPYGNDVANLMLRDTVVNLHFGIPHKRDGGRDDIQLLYDNESIQSALYNSGYDMGIPSNPNDPLFGDFSNAFLVPFYSDYYTYTGQTGTLLPANYASLVQPYLFPSSPQNRAFGMQIPLDVRDVGYNDQAIAKLQYQKNFGSDSYLRLYGYTYYSDYIGTGPVSTYEFTGFDSNDYELSAHTRGVSATFAKQFGPNLLQVEGSYTTADAIRMYNEQPYGAFGAAFNPEDNFAVLVNPADLAHGVCYTAPSAGTVATPASCSPSAGLATFASLGGIGSGSALPPNPASYTCGGNPCAFFVGGNGQYGEYNDVLPRFTGFSVTDQYQPTDKLTINAGLRLDRYDFKGDNTDTGPARTFWFNSFNYDTCYDTQNATLVDKGLAVGSSCSTFGPQYVDLISPNGTPNQYTLLNTPSQEYIYNIFEPRFGITYTVNSDTVLRASFGRYNEQPTSAYEQYDALQANLPALLSGFYSLGFRTPGHDVRPPISYNTDFSIEHHFPGTSVSIKLTPFLRQTHDEIENFYTSTKAGIISGLNAGNQTSKGFELALTAGDFNRNGLAGQFSFAYTDSYVKYSTLPNGQSLLSPINADIQVYNAYTSYCAAHPSSTPSNECYTGPGGVANTTNGLTAAPCYTAAGAPDAGCAAGDVGNPYWNSPPQPLLDPNGAYPPFSINPGGIGTGVNAYNYPYVASLILSYKHDKFSISPALQFVAGNRYGAPETTPGMDPAAGCSPLATQVPNDPRYPYGVPGGSEYDAGTCAGSLVIPDPYTGKFDSLGGFREPAQLLGHLRISYDVSPKATLTLTLANLLSTCFGGQQTAFTYYQTNKVCSYTNLADFVSPVGNLYNPGDNVQEFLRYPYEPSFGTFNDQTSSLGMPFTAYLSLQIKL
ncbi:MAG TPA: TonB-dependent receptor [Candidatus Baltobacteraceae bacterium]|nr:TonB-dependent receptor [Candidatus Baltobacteraceae bacterium]